MTVVVDKSYDSGPYVEFAYCTAPGCAWQTTTLMSASNHARHRGPAHVVQVERRLTGTYRQACGECGAVLVEDEQQHTCDLVVTR